MTEPYNALKTFVEHPHASVRRLSAIEGIRGILQLSLYPEHKAELLHICLWQLTQAESTHKHRTRFMSERAMRKLGKLRHDHVFQRGMMVERLLRLDDHTGIEGVLQPAVACTVTKSEHDDLSAWSRRHPDVDGWERYRQLGTIRVIDTKLGEECSFSKVGTQ